MSKEIVFSVEDFAKSLKEVFLRNNAHSIENERNSPLNKMFYLAFKEFKEKELLDYDLDEARTGNYWDRKQSIYDKVLQSESKLLFSVILEKEIFKDRLFELSNIFIDKMGVKNMSDSMIEFIHIFESSRKNNDEEALFFECFVDYLKKSYSESSLSDLDGEIVNIFVKSKYQENFKKKFLNECGRMNEDLAQMILSYFKQAGDDLTKENFLNKFLPKDDKTNFFISALNNDEMLKLTKLGFKFDQSDYEYNGMSLVTNLLKSGRKDLTDIIIPGLKSLKTKPHLVEEQNLAIKEYSFNPKIKELLINMLVYELDNNLSNKDNDNKRLKI